MVFSRAKDDGHRCVPKRLTGKMLPSGIIVICEQWIHYSIFIYERYMIAEMAVISSISFNGSAYITYRRFAFPRMPDANTVTSRRRHYNAGYRTPHAKMATSRLKCSSKMSVYDGYGADIDALTESTFVFYRLAGRAFSPSTISKRRRHASVTRQCRLGGDSLYSLSDVAKRRAFSAAAVFAAYTAVLRHYSEAAAAAFARFYVAAADTRAAASDTRIVPACLRCVIAAAVRAYFRLPHGHAADIGRALLFL